MPARRSTAVLGVALLAAAGLPRAQGQGAQCVRVEVETWGRPGHGGSVDLHTATHRLIRALDRLLELDEGAEWILATRILGLEGGPAVNVKPRRARAEVELEPAPGTGLATVREAVVEALGRSWLEARVASAPCREKSPRAGGEGP